MSETYTHICRGTCSRSITIKYDKSTNKILDMKVVGGCDGNLKGINELIKGMDMDVVHDKLIGVRCGPRPTSCPNQLALAIEEIKAQEK